MKESERLVSSLPVYAVYSRRLLPARFQRDNTGGAAILRRTSHRTSSLRLSHGAVKPRGGAGFAPPVVFFLVSSRASAASVSFTRARRLSSKCLSQSSRLSFSPRAARAARFALSTFASARACACANAAAKFCGLRGTAAARARASVLSSAFFRNASLRQAAENCAARATRSVTRYCPGVAPRVAGIAERITEPHRFDSEAKRAESIRLDAAAEAATTRVRVGEDGDAELGRAASAPPPSRANLGADPNVHRGVLASRGLPHVRLDDAVEGVRGSGDSTTDMGAPSAPRATAARRASADFSAGAIPDGAFFFAVRGVRLGEVGTRVGSSASRAASRALGPCIDAARAFAAEAVVRAARRGRADAAGPACGGTAASSAVKAASAESCLRNSRITSSETSSWPSCASCSRTASTEIPARVSAAESIVPPVTATANVDD